MTAVAASTTPTHGTGTASDAVASVRDLQVSFPTSEGVVAALRGVTLDLRPGEIVALVGESGSGKSVLGQAILGLLPRGPTITGSVDVAGVDMVDGTAKDARIVRRDLLGAVFQDPLTSLNPTMRVGRQLTERGGDLASAQERLEEAGVPDARRRLKQYPHELSGGLRQRAMIALALGASGTPRLIVADEPTTALDVSVQAQIVLLFDRLRREHGCAVLFVTHDLGVAASVADRIAVLYAGRLAEVGPTAEVLDHPAYPYTRALLGSRLSVDGRRAAEPLSGEPPSPLALPPGCAFAPRCPRAQPACDAAPPELALRPDGVGTAACLFPHTPDEAPTRMTAVAVRPAAPPALGHGHDTWALDVVDVEKSYKVGRRREVLRAVAGVSLRVPVRGAMALVGESGCGKTTTLRMATGLLTPDRGHVTWAEGAGRPQLVFQDAGSSLTPWLSVGAQVEERLRALGVRKADREARALEVLGRVGLDRRAARAKPRELSGGQRQRAAIARALASEPSLLVCDEPVSALDASLAVRVLGLLESLRDDLGVALLVVTHDLAAARRIADKVAVMYLGRIVESAPVATLFDSPSHPYTQGLIAASPTTEAGRLSPTLAGEPPSAIVETVGCPFAPRCPKVQDRCRVEAPVLAVAPSGGLAACHYAD